LQRLTLAPEIEGMAGRQLPMRMVTIEPGGVFGPIHDHRDRPGIVYILQGTITDHRNRVATDYGPGVGWPRIGTPHTGSRTEERCRRWRSRSISSGKSKRRPDIYLYLPWRKLSKRRRIENPANESFQGAERIRTAVRGFAGLCLTSRPRRPADRLSREIVARPLRALLSFHGINACSCTGRGLPPLRNPHGVAPRDLAVPAVPFQARML
jgi:uncharacterized cupin superfamily protein